MDIKYQGKTFTVSQVMWDAMNQQASERGMTIDEYIAEAFMLLREKDEKFKDNMERHEERNS